MIKIQEQMNTNHKQQNIICKHCASKNTIKKGLKKNKLRTIQKYQCKDCKKHFTSNTSKNTTYNISTIVKAISLHNLGHSLTQVSEIISKDKTPKIPPTTISSWLKKYKQLTTYNKLRNQAKKIHSPKDIIFKKPLKHVKNQRFLSIPGFRRNTQYNQVYPFKFHKAKLNLLPKLNKKLPKHTIKNLKLYLNTIPTKEFPHHIFSSEQRNEAEQRGSQLKFPILKFLKKQKNNYANKLAELALKTAKNNHQRHQVIQDFMLINDTTTIAIEIPIYLTNDDIKYFLKRNFKLPLKNQQAPITGHIDILQLRNNLLHILDYKPEANKTNPINQLTLYALALASRLQIPLKQFKCAWFDQYTYHEFFPLHTVYEKRARGIINNE